jgi:hypothetical protein
MGGSLVNTNPHHLFEKVIFQTRYLDDAGASASAGTAQPGDGTYSPLSCNTGPNKFVGVSFASFLDYSKKNFATLSKMPHGLVCQNATCHHFQLLCRVSLCRVSRCLIFTGEARRRPTWGI